ncbi:MAG: 2OG-Fe dioxygenase family protein [Candidatus Melainabacteria bacterium]|nr:2OG-Fe dioxygenase family protein [Candidatus Melainabacteria bacterium]
MSTFSKPLANAAIGYEGPLNLPDAITRQGYVLVPRKHLALNGLEISLAALSQSWNCLAPDPMFDAKDGVRLRRYGRIQADMSNRVLAVLSHQLFNQSKTLNTKYGGYDRSFAPMEPELLENVFFRQLIWFNLAYLPLSEAERQVPWEVGVHQIRMVTSRQQPANATPEGPHQDGFRYVTQHLIAMHHLTGGESRLYLDKTLPPVVVAPFESPMDSRLLDDTRVFHDAAGVQVLPGFEQGIRDMLILTFQPLPTAP